MRRRFDQRIRRVGNSHVITLPAATIERFGLKEGDFITVTISTDEEKKK